MKKSKQASPARKPQVQAGVQSDVQDDALAKKLAGLALDLRALDDYATLPDELKKKQSELRKLVKKCLQQDKDATLAEALEQAREEDGDAWTLLRTTVEELSETVIYRRDQGPDLEVNAFVVPIFVRSSGGLRSEQCFQDEEAFALLRESFQECGLESRQANVVLVSHAYHLAEMDRIGYSQLAAMVHEAFEAMTRKKAATAPAIAQSMSGWPENHFSPADRAVELRFLLGFALKTLDDPFYQVPEKEAAADRYFDARAQRFRDWAQKVSPLIKRCLVTDGRELDLDFLYQDLFHGGRAAAVGELQMLQMISELQQALDERGIAPGACKAVVGPADADDETIVRVHLMMQTDGPLIATSEKPVEFGRTVQIELDDVCDALQTLGVQSLALAVRFDAEDMPVELRPYSS